MLTLLASDIHLHPTRPETARLFGAFISGPATDAQELYLLGDLFDAWAGDDDLADPFNAAFCARLKALSDAGTSLYFLPGNRDFLVGAAFAAASGCTLVADETVANIAGQPTLLLHGDTLCTDDVEYQGFRATVRSAAWSQQFLAKPLAQRKAEIEALRARSEQEKRIKPMALMDTNDAAVAATFARHDVRHMIHGHTHRAAHHRHADGTERWVLPEWHRHGGYLACDADDCRLIDFPPGS